MWKSFCFENRFQKVAKTLENIFEILKMKKNLNLLFKKNNCKLRGNYLKTKRLHCLCYGHQWSINNKFSKYKLQFVIPHFVFYFLQKWYFYLSSMSRFHYAFSFSTNLVGFFLVGWGWGCRRERERGRDGLATFDVNSKECPFSLALWHSFSQCWVAPYTSFW